MCAVRPEGSSSEVLHPQKPLPVQGLVHRHVLLLRVSHVLPHHAQHPVFGDAGMSGGIMNTHYILCIVQYSLMKS